MDIKVLTRTEQAAHPALFEAMHRQRHQVFAVKLGWTALRSDDGLEIDGFDRPDAHYLVAHEGDEVHGSLRLLPAWRRSMLLECWPRGEGRTGATDRGGRTQLLGGLTGFVRTNLPARLYVPSVGPV